MFPPTEPTTPPDARAASIEVVSSELPAAAAAPVAPAPSIPASSGSRQLRWQKKQLKLANCRQCGRPKVTKHHCAECAEKMRIKARNRYRLKVGIPIDAPLTGNGRPLFNSSKVQVSSDRSADQNLQPSTYTLTTSNSVQP